MEKTEKNTSGELAGIGELLRKSWEVYRGRMKTLIPAGLAAVLLPVLSLVPPVGLGLLASQYMPQFQMIIMAASILLGVAGMVWVGNWGVSAFLTAIVDQKCGIKEAFLKAKPKVMAHIWLGILTGLILTGAHLLLVIPGIIFAVWFFFAPFVFIEENLRGMDALLKSKEYVRGRWLGVGLRLLAVWCLSVLVSCIPFVGQLLALFLVPFSFVYTFLVYKDLKTLKGDVSFRPSRKEKAGIIATSAVGIVAPALIVFAFMGSMALMPFSMLKAKVTGESPFAAVTKTERFQGVTTKTPAVKVRPVVSSVGTQAGPGSWSPKNQSKDGTTAAQDQPKDKKAEKPSPGPLVASSTPAKKKAPAKSLSLVAKPRSSLLSGKESKKYRDLIKVCDKAIKIQPADSLSYHNRAVAHFKLGNHLEAVKDFTKAIELNPKDAKAYYNRAIAYGWLNKHKDAIEDGIKALELNPKDASAFINRGIDYIALGKYDEALGDFDKAIKLNVQDASVYYARGVAYHKQGEEEKALKDFQNAAKMGSTQAKQYLESRQKGAPS